AASVGGFQLLIMGQGWLVYELSGSPLDLGFLGAASSIPTIAAALAGGVIADRVDRRRMLIVTSSIIAGLLVLLAALDGTGVVAVWHVLAIAAAIALIAGLDFPSRQAFFPSLIPREQMMSAVALNSMLWQGSRMVLPGLGGVVIALVDTWAVFAAGAIGFMAMTRVMASFTPTPAAEVPLATGHSGRQFVDGIRYIASHRLFWVLILLTYATTFFGISYVQLMPAFARLLGVGETGYGLLLSATGVGAITGNLIAAPLQRSPRLGRLMVAAPMGGAVAIVGFALCVALLPDASIGYVLALVCGMLTAVCMSMYFVASMTQLQLAVPDALRGRVMGIYTICFSLVPLGGLLGGVVAAVTSPPFAAALNAGVLAAIVVVMAITQPA
ncbi:MAG: MFS transporter, partial [Thiotrichales bacterium]|nr:MFS transporter [Thiotrichales bacterium]